MDRSALRRISLVSSQRSYSRFLFLVVLLCALFLICSSHLAMALPLKTEQRRPNFCSQSTQIVAELRLEGFHIDRSVLTLLPIQIVAEDIKIRLPTLECIDFLAPVLEYQWELLSRPPASTASLIPTLKTASLTPDVAGEYTVRFIACPNGCLVTIQDDLRFTALRQDFDITITAQNSLVIPPQIEPVLPLLTETQPTETDDSGKCDGGGGVIDPQWVTVNAWERSRDYELLEGKVVFSRISRKDNFLNHDSQDHIFHVIPDPPYRFLLPADAGGQSDIEVEWERDHFPEPFRPTPGDRVSVFGYWVHDCGHGPPFRTEIHPPVGIAVQRPRPILIDETERFFFTFPLVPLGAPPLRDTVGSNVYVPGIVTEIFFNRNAGAITNGCDATALHQPYSGQVDDDAELKGFCIPTRLSGGPSPIERSFQFNIYLPRQPQALVISEGIGKVVPQVPLFVQTQAHPLDMLADGPDPHVELKRDANGVDYLAVTVDLSMFEGTQYARRIVAGWVYAAPDNWGLKKWKLQINSLDVDNNADDGTDGDWRFWVNTNNTGQEWTKLIDDCDDCVPEGTIDFAGRPFQTGDTVSPDRSLGPDLLLFPAQKMWVHTSGYEDDLFVSDDTGAVNDRFIPPVQGTARSSMSNCKEETDDTPSGCGHYTLHYSIEPVSISPPSLSATAQDQYNSYILSIATPTATAGPARIVCAHCGIVLEPWDPFDLQIDEPIRLIDTALFEPQEREEFALTDIRLEDFAQLILEKRQTQPQDVDSLFQKLRSEVDLWVSMHGRDGIDATLCGLQTAVPADLWDKHFGDMVLKHTRGRDRKPHGCR